MFANNFDNIIPKISGPVSISCYKHNNIMYIFFGDMHNKTSLCSPCTLENNCRKIDDLLNLIVQNASKNETPIDIYLENSYHINDVNNLDYQDSPLSDVIKKFSGCLTKNKIRTIDSCPYSRNIHFHYCDIRNLISDYLGNTINTNGIIGYNIYTTFDMYIKINDTNALNIFFNNFMLFYDNFYNKRQLFIELYLSENGRKNFDALVDLFNIFPEFHSHFFYDFEIQKKLFNNDTHKIYKQIKYCNQSTNIIQFISRLILQKFDDMKIIYDQIKKNDNFVNLDANTKIDKLKIFCGLLLNISSYLMDAYLLGRLFKVDGYDSELRICYTGDFHKKNYDTFFVDTLGIQPCVNILEIPSTYTQCISGVELLRIFKPHFFVDEQNLYTTEISDDNEEDIFDKFINYDSNYYKYKYRKYYRKYMQLLL